jgi:hypothetical protein
MYNMNINRQYWKTVDHFRRRNILLSSNKNNYNLELMKIYLLFDFHRYSMIILVNLRFRKHVLPLQKNIINIAFNNLRLSLLNL